MWEDLKWGKEFEEDFYKKNYIQQYKGHQWLFKFDSGLGASVVRHSFSYGSEQGLFELALISWKGDNYELVYNDEYNDVVGYLSNSNVLKHLQKIKRLKGDNK